MLNNCLNICFYDEKMNQKSLYWGMGITAVWLAVIIAFWIFGGLKPPSSLNELGDFLAGIVAPIAFLWLILGYVQQGKQLDQNTKALEQQERALQLQIDEMRESVKQQKELVQIQEKQFFVMNQAETPILKIDIQNMKFQKNSIKGLNGWDGYNLNLKIQNFGGDAIKIKIVSNQNENLGNIAAILRKEEVQFSLTLFERHAEHLTNTDLAAYFCLEFEDIFGNSMKWKYLIIGQLQQIIDDGFNCDVIKI